MKLDVKNFDNLEFEKQCEIIKGASFLDKGDLILRSQNPEVIIPSMSPEDFYLIYSSSGHEIQPQLLNHVNSEQLLLSSDFECWENDQINKTGFLTFLEQLSLASRNRLYLWLIEADFELIISSFIKYVEVIKTQHLELIDDYIGDRPFITLDNLYYFCIEAFHYDVIRKSIELLFERNHNLYVSLMESLICVNELEIVEDAFTHRNHRLATYGFPDLDEAMKIYIVIDNWASTVKKENKNINVLNTLEKRQYSLPIIKEYSDIFLDQVLELYYQKFNINLDTEFVWLANKIIICNKWDIKQSETLKKGLKRAKDTVSIALEDLSHGKLDIALDILNNYWVEDIHRWGVTRLLKLQIYAKNIYNECNFVNYAQFYKFLGSPWNSLFEGLFQFFPLKVKEEASFYVEEHENFVSLKDVENVFYKINEMNSHFKFLKKYFGNDWDMVLEKSYHLFNNREENINYNSLLATCFIHIIINGTVSFEPLKENQIKDFIQKAFNNDLKISFKEEILFKLKEKLQLEAFYNKKTLILDYILRNIKDEIGHLNIDDNIKPKYISVVLMEPTKQVV